MPTEKPNSREGVLLFLLREHLGEKLSRCERVGNATQRTPWRIRSYRFFQRTPSLVSSTR